MRKDRTIARILGVILACLMAGLMVSPASGVANAAGSPQFYLSFPLPNHTAYDVTINAVFDHSMSELYYANDEVVAYTGEKGQRANGFRLATTYQGRELYGFRNEAAANFRVNGDYSGSTYLYYDGHPGYDFRTTDQSSDGKVDVLAAADGTAYLGDESIGKIQIDHGNGYRTNYIHLSQRNISDGQKVSRGQKIGVSGDKGAEGQPHLHFSVEKQVAGQWLPVDPYGWEGSGDDPYQLAANQNLWRAEQPLDLVFVIDTTSSMSDDIAAVKAASTDIINSIDSKVTDYRIALVDYRDFPVSPYGGSGDYPAMTRLAFTADKTAAISAINALSLGWGADWQESVYSALRHAILDPSVGGWRGGGSKQIILMGDAPPHDPEPFTGYSLKDVVDAANSVDPAIVQTIAIGGDTSLEEAFSNIASATKGRLFTAATGDEVVQAIMDAIGEAIEPGPSTDTVPPSIDILPGVSSNYTQDTPLSYIARDDGGSGLAGSSATLDGAVVTNPVSLSIPGPHTYVVTAVDVAGNVATKTISFNVYAFSWGPPLDKGAGRKIQLNATLPVKFSILDAGGDFVADPSVSLTLYDSTGSQRLGPFVYGVNNPNTDVHSEQRQYIHTLRTNDMRLVAGDYEIRVTFNSASLVGRNSIFIEIQQRPKTDE